MQNRGKISGAAQKKKILQKSPALTLDSARKNPYNSCVAHPDVAQLVARMVRERPNFKFLRILKFWLRDSFFARLVS